MTSSAEYASMMEMDEALIRYFLAGPEEVAEKNLNDLLELKALVQPLDPKVAWDVVRRNCGNRPATIECLRKLGKMHSGTTAMNGVKGRAHEKKEKSFFGWLFKKKTKRATSMSSHEDESSNSNHHDTPPPAEFVENTSSHTIPDESSAEPITNEKAQGAGQFLLARPFIKRTPEEEELSREYNFASSPNNASSVKPEASEEFQKIFNQFVKSMS
ncbi:uncharacterized protein Tco025E_05137 [Trypanosoma conorhini]|uniref:Uncharacterized protein n=1 Tax=Trypanosoma conorhini TaxID=83891 RepID=A0A3R7NCR7_9TRYP|nr:uncharacterized protein Tco025E_05137 [Trypanosoma conorhini]RNF16668.1 hypothetical protein Tco025E_05137 [Trypanosoma conorhini]